jgi:hypothetical protein
MQVLRPNLKSERNKTEMTINSVKIILLIFISSIFYSCKGQVKSEHKKIETETKAIAKVVADVG